jgi:hypothetical protein
MGPLSQWYRKNFVVSNITFNTAEQYMMYKKAELFNDTDTMQKILNESHPKKQKELGREVTNFDKIIWENNCKKFVYDGNYAKFSQNVELKKYITELPGTLVEASPEDVIWGIGMSENNVDCFDRTKWKGKNWLGEILTQVKETLIKEIKNN